MSNKPLIFSLLCTLALTVLGLWMWISLPEAEQYPIHWNAAGEADGFAGRNAVLGVLMIMPITQTFMTALLYFIPKIEPLRQNFEESRAAYNWVWVGLMAFLTLTGIMNAMMYHGGGSKTLGEATIMTMAIGTSLLLIGIGNVMGKVRQNFMFGIRTPWTLSSDLSWEKTHRIGGRLFVGAGLIGVILAFINPLTSILVTTALILLAVLICVIYSYKVWKSDPNKRS